jgi:dicarboxylate transporter 10
MSTSESSARATGPAAAATTAPPASSKKKTAAPPAVKYPFWFGGSSSSMAACVTHPLDLVKVRLQMRTANAPKSMSGTFMHILRTAGPAGLYSGISASLLRQITYSTVRFGVYEELKARAATTATTTTTLPDGTVTTSTAPAQAPFPVLVALAAASGFLGGISGNVADVLNVRMQHDAALPPHRRRNYRHALDGWVRMTRDEGVRGWFRGWWPNSVRAAAMTASQLASYDVAKRALVDAAGMRPDALATHFGASFLAGIVAATVTNPVDVVKTRVMNASAADKGARVVGVVGDLYRADGVRWMFRGWVPSFLRLGP